MDKGNDKTVARKKKLSTYAQAVELSLDLRDLFCLDALAFCVSCIQENVDVLHLKNMHFKRLFHKKRVCRKYFGNALTSEFQGKSQQIFSLLDSVLLGKSQMKAINIKKRYHIYQFQILTR